VESLRLAERQLDLARQLLDAQPGGADVDLHVGRGVGARRREARDWR
jgi:hypothetical protein